MKHQPAHLGRLVQHLAACIVLGSSLCATAHDWAPDNDTPATANARAAIFKANPQLLKSIMLGGGFGTELSYAIANHMYSRSNIPAILDARAKLKVETLGPGIWLLRFPIVNVAVFETAEGLVLVDTGYAPAGPALLETIKALSPKPVHTIIYTHYHADHAFGAWAIVEAGMHPQIVAEERFVEQLEADMRSYGVIARNNQQRQVPRTWADAVRPTLTFHKQLTLKIGGEDFVLTHARGETEDQIWVSVPGRKVVLAADYFQNFLPNAGNGKRRQRYAEDWARALRAMAALQPDLLLPAHGPAITNATEIQDRLPAQARMLESISDQVINGLNAGLRRDLVIDRVALPPDLASRDDAREIYVSARNIGRMVAAQYGGWWDDMPSHWDPAPRAAQARALATLAGGARKLIAQGLALADQDPALACNLADWAWLAAETDMEVMQGALAVYAKRVARPLPTQEALVYAEHMTRLQLAISQAQAAEK